MFKRSFAVALALGASSTPALACTGVESVMAHFEKVKNAYLEKAPNMKPDEFPIWSGHLERFGDAMGVQDFAGACQALDDAAVELGFDVAAAPTSTISGSAAATAPAAPAQGGGLIFGSGVTTGSGVVVGSEVAPTASETQAESLPVRTRARPDRIRIY